MGFRFGLGAPLRLGAAAGVRDRRQIRRLHTRDTKGERRADEYRERLFHGMAPPAGEEKEARAPRHA